MSKHPFLTGIGMGAAAGAALGMAMAPKKKEMKAAAKQLEFEHAAYLRDRIKKLQAGK